MTTAIAKSRKWVRQENGNYLPTDEFIGDDPVLALLALNDSKQFDTMHGYKQEHEGRDVLVWFIDGKPEVAFQDLQQHEDGD